MTEIGITVALAIFTALGAATKQLHSKIDDLDKRVDRHELRVAENYLPKQDFSAAMDKLEAHLVRLESKLDRIVQ